MHLAVGLHLSQGARCVQSHVLTLCHDLNAYE